MPKKPHTLASSAGLFAKRGDDWLTPREQTRLFNRNPELENADFDAQKQRLSADFWERKRKLEQEAARTIVANPKPIKSPSFLERIANVRCKHRAIAKERKVTVVTSGKKSMDVKPDNIPVTVPAGSKEPSRQKQTPPNISLKSHYDFSGKNMPKEIKKSGKVYRIK